MGKLATVAAAALALFALHPSVIAAEMDAPKDMDWPHSGPFGTYDRAAVQRGFLVYKENCAACHSLKFVHYRNLAEIGFSVDQVKAIAAGDMVIDGPNGDGEMFERPGEPRDRFIAPFPNDSAAAAANNGAVPPDLSLMVKARKGHESYVYSILTGYAEAPADVEMMEGLTYNPYFPGKQIAMPPPLSEDGVEYADGTKATVDQMAYDVVNFLAWASEPTLEVRKAMGIKVVLFLLLFSVVLYAVKRKIWSDVH